MAVFLLLSLSRMLSVISFSHTERGTKPMVKLVASMIETAWAMGIGWFVGCWLGDGVFNALFTKAHSSESEHQ